MGRGIPSRFWHLHPWPVNSWHSMNREHPTSVDLRVDGTQQAFKLSNAEFIVSLRALLLPIRAERERERRVDQIEQIVATKFRLGKVDSDTIKTTYPKSNFLLGFRPLNFENVRKCKHLLRIKKHIEKSKFLRDVPADISTGGSVPILPLSTLIILAIFQQNQLFFGGGSKISARGGHPEMDDLYGMRMGGHWSLISDKRKDIFAAFQNIYCNAVLRPIPGSKKQRLQCESLCPRGRHPPQRAPWIRACSSYIKKVFFYFLFFF